MKIWNTMGRRLEDFVPLQEGHVRLYTCGPTVYDYAHIGNFRAYVFEDLLRRVLKYEGYRITQVMNLTDVDDKTIRGAAKAGIPLADYTRRFKDAFFDDLKALAIEPAEHYPAATDHVPDMVAMIDRLLRGGYAYRSEDGSVYFSIAKWPGYGKLAHLDMSGLKAGARVSHDEYEKENVADFALWKAWDEADGEVVWDAPWGRGRPGWHIECSAMSTRYLGETFDIHTGGVDNIFPHHEDEMAQSEAATGKPFVRYWMHCAHLVVDGRKMSKSLGNFHTLRDVLGRGYSGREVRYVLISAHYRQTLNFSFDALDGARASLARLDEFAGRLRDQAAAPVASKGLPAWAEHGRERFRSALAEDLAISEALAALFDMVHDGNRAMDDGPLGGSASAVIDLLADFDRVLGFLSASQAEVDADVQALVDKRELARKNRDWAESDRLRKQLADAGWDVRDTPEGPKLKPRAP